MRGLRPSPRPRPRLRLRLRLIIRLERGGLGGSTPAKPDKKTCELCVWIYAVHPSPSGLSVGLRLRLQGRGSRHKYNNRLGLGLRRGGVSLSYNHR